MMIFIIIMEKEKNQIKKQYNRRKLDILPDNLLQSINKLINNLMIQVLGSN